MWAFSSCSEQGLLVVVVCGLLIAVASHCRAWALGVRASVVAARGLRSCSTRALERTSFSSCGLWALSAGSVVVVCRLSCSMAYGIFPGQGSNPCPLHWQAES